MTVNTTEFRKNVFTLMDRALKGELIEIAHKGQTLRLVPTEKPSKLSRLMPRDTIVGSPEDFDRALKQLHEEMVQSTERL